MVLDLQSACDKTNYVIIRYAINELSVHDILKNLILFLYLRMLMLERLAKSIQSYHLAEIFDSYL